MTDDINALRLEINQLRNALHAILNTPAARDMATQLATVHAIAALALDLDIEPTEPATLPAGAVEVDSETAYGSTVRLSRCVRVF